MKKNFKLTSLVAALLCALMILAACGDMGKVVGDIVDKNFPDGLPTYGNGYDVNRELLLPPDKSSLSIPDVNTDGVVSFADMEYSRPDGEAVKAQIEDLTQKIINAKSFDEMLAYDQESGEILESFWTMASLANLRNSMDLRDEYFEEEKNYCSDTGVSLSILNTELNRAIVEGPFAEEYKAHHGEYVFNSIVNSLRLASPETEALQQKREQLVTEYFKLMDEEFTAVYNDVIYTEDDIYDIAESYEELILLYGEIYAQNAQPFADLYAQMVEIDKEVAALLGFESAADMYYLEYSRDYTPKDSLKFCKNAKKFMADLSIYGVYGASPYGYYNMDDSFNTMPVALAQMDGELAAVWEAMVDFGLTDYENRPSKQGGAYTTLLYDFRAPFCFGSWEDDFYSLETVIHEFGHFFDFWLHVDDDVVQNLDVAEIYSQGLELLMHPYYDYFTGDVEETLEAELSSFGSIITAITYQSMLEEFQLIAYELESFDAEELARIYTQLSKEYGFEEMSYFAQDGYTHSWYAIMHLFRSPFYTISYSTSAFAAAQIYLESLDDHSAAVQTYLTMLKSDQNRPFLEIIGEAGLGDPFSATEMQELANVFWSIYDEIFE